MVCQFFTDSWVRNFVDLLVVWGGGGLKGMITPKKFILFETSYLSLHMLLQYIIVSVNQSCLNRRNVQRGVL